MPMMTFEDAVRWYRAQPGMESAIRANYFDLPLENAAERFLVSEEFQTIIGLLGEGNGRTLLDFGAGNGIASVAFARHGYQVTAFEPGPSQEVGAGAIRHLAKATQANIRIEDRLLDPLPFADGQFDVVFVRMVLHHLPDLARGVRELHRVLRRGGTMLVLREHVVSNDVQLKAFLKAHPLHHLHGGEWAYPLWRYLWAFVQAGFWVTRVWGPYNSVLNFYPGTEAERLHRAEMECRRRLGRLAPLGRIRALQEAVLCVTTVRDQTPGRIYSFLLKKR